MISRTPRSTQSRSSVASDVSKRQAMHCSVFCKLAEAPKPADLMEAGEELGSWEADIDDSLRRETHASTLYAEFAGRATTPRLVEVWKEVSAIEADHIELDGIAKRYM